MKTKILAAAAALALALTTASAFAGEGHSSLTDCNNILANSGAYAHSQVQGCK